MTVCQHRARFGRFSLIVPLGTQVLGTLGAEILTAEPETATLTETLTFEALPTGGDVDPTAHYLGSFEEGLFTWHLFQRSTTATEQSSPTPTPQRSSSAASTPSTKTAHPSQR